MPQGIATSETEIFQLLVQVGVIWNSKVFKNEGNMMHHKFANPSGHTLLSLLQFYR